MSSEIARVVVLDTVVSVRVAPDVEREPFAALTRLYARTDKRPQIVYDVRLADGSMSEIALWRDEQCLYRSSEPADLPPAFELDLYETVMAAMPNGLFLHAGGVVLANKALILAGASGTGKSTLIQALVNKGALYISDEWVHIDCEGRVRGIQRPICHDHWVEGSWRYAVPSRAGGLSVQYLTTPGAAVVADAVVVLGCLVTLQGYGADNPHIESVTGAAALTQLWQHVLRPNDEASQCALSISQRFPIMSLKAAGIESTVDLLLQLG